MLFSSPIFIFAFLPVALTGHMLMPNLKARNAWLLLVSLFFYVWGEPGFVLLLLGSTLLNFALGRWIDRSQTNSGRKLAVVVAVATNVGLLAVFKYGNLAVGMVNSVLHVCGFAGINPPNIPLPLGISFFTFHALSYVIDVYRRNWKPASERTDLGLYIFFFPQLIAGPILRWKAIGPQLVQRSLCPENVAEGIRRFAGGLAKKVLIANTVALPADQIFALPARELSPACAWFGILCYTLQIYFDFSGYSDMAVGMGKMLGFKFLENFNFPYVAQSLRDFWRRWHISLSSWFRDYVYFPLGGNRGSAARTCLNLTLVFCLCGLWHGANATFVVWGLYHGLFLAVERTRLGDWLAKLPRVLRHSYTLLLVMGGWVIFRANSMAAMAAYFRALAGACDPGSAAPLWMYVTPQVLWAIIFGFAFSGPLWSALEGLREKVEQAVPARIRTAARVVGMGLDASLVLGALVACSAWLAGGTYNPFIYYRF
jgi:alginate O-acetyltransferase complex protein AlgI